MRKALLLHNPQSGRQRHHRRLATIEAVRDVFRQGGVDVEIATPDSPHAAAPHVRSAISNGIDTIVACGGDGTVHQALQALAGTEAALGVIPMGTANALANDLGLGQDPLRAAQLTLNSRVRPVRLGKLSFRSSTNTEESRYFILAAGVGLDAAMFYQLAAASKQQLGVMGYYVEALRQWSRQKYPFFEVEFRDLEGATRKERVTQVLAVRLNNFGGIIKRLAPGANLDRSSVDIVAGGVVGAASTVGLIVNCEDDDTDGLSLRPEELIIRGTDTISVVHQILCILKARWPERRIDIDG